MGGRGGEGSSQLGSVAIDSSCLRTTSLSAHFQHTASELSPMKLNRDKKPPTMEAGSSTANVNLTPPACNLGPPHLSVCHVHLMYLN